MDDLRSYTFGDLLAAVGAKTPSPGGGAVASAVGALAAALGRMVVSYSLGRKSLALHAKELEHAAEVLDRAALVLVELAREDAEAFDRVATLLKLPESDPKRQAELGATIDMALQPPRATIAACADLLRLMEELAPITNKNLRSDLAIAAVLADAAAHASWWNVAINLPLLPDPEGRDTLAAQTRAILQDIAARRQRVEAACAV